MSVITDVKGFNDCLGFNCLGFAKLNEIINIMNRLIG